MSMKKYFILPLFAWMLCLFTLQANATLTAQLDRYQITEGETARLTIEARGQVSTMPDTKALTKDFDVSGLISGSRVNIINGKIDSRTTWTLSLIPKRSGKLTIPSLTINGEQTPTLTLQVTETSAGSGSDTTPVFIETEVDKTDPYVQGMVRYTLRVFFAVTLAQGSLSEPELENALVHRIGEDREYTSTRDGRTFHVIEREYIIFPQTSGNLMIPGPVLDAQIPQNTAQNDPFFNRLYTNTRPIRLRGEAIMLTVRPRPDQSTSQYWLPAQSVELFEDWKPADGQISVGDPLTRHITIKALGVTGEQLPDLQFQDIEGFKIYPDRAESNTQNLQHNIQGEKTLRLAYMPTQPGKYTLPALSLHWWDTQTDSEQVVTLKERNIDVIPAQNTSAQTPSSTARGDSITQQLAPTNDAQRLLAEDNTTNEMLPFNQNSWFWTSLVFAALWLITLGFWWRKRDFLTENTQKKKTANPEPANSRKARKLFLAACKENDAQHARHYLLLWASNHWPQSPPKGLDDLALRFDDPAISAALTTLDRMLYQHKNESWNGQELANLIAKLPEHDNSPNNKSDLPDLYVRN